MKNLTKLFCDLLSLGSQLGDASTSNEHIGHHLRSLAVRKLPEDCDVNFEEVDMHVANLRAKLRGADRDIDDVCAHLAAGQPVSIKKITELHDKMSVHLSDGQELTFNYHDIIHY